MNHPVLFTERLILRPVAAEDFEDWAAFHADPVTMKFLGGVQERSAAWRGLCAMRGSWDINGFSMFALIERTSGRWIGRVGPWQPEGWPGTEIAWGVVQAFAGKGYAYETAVAAMHYAVDVLGWTDIIHTIDPDNEGSIALAKRLGSINQGPTQLPAPYAAARVNSWGQSAADWLARRTS